jgi:pyruvate formate lyase activating enzyme
MDIKNSIEKYDKATSVKTNIENIKKSVEIIRNSGVDYEFRMTVMPKLHSINDIRKVGEWLKGSKKFFIQNFHPNNCLDASYDKEAGFDIKELEEMKKVLDGFIEMVGFRE